MKLLLATLFFVACVVVVASAQSVQQPAFEVVSIRPHDPAVRRWSITMPPHGEVSIVGMSLRDLIIFAYNVRDYQILGAPKWWTSDKYDIRAKGQEDEQGAPAPRLTMDQQRARIQSLLGDSFALRLHHETRQSQVYFLTVAKTGLKMQVASGNDPKASGKGAILPWALIVTELSIKAEGPIVDKTGLTGAYYAKLRYSTIDGHAAGIGIPSDQLDDNNPGPFLDTALQQQLGLHLQSGKGPIDTLVIDSVSKPSEN
jgi:bla regulator protein blaR1